jgi:glyoxylase-like metal-dependent hydrolase (beta-lactamase superfamily II)
MPDYSLWLVEYARCDAQPVSSLVYSHHNQGLTSIPFSFLVIRGEGRTIAVDTGYFDVGYGHELSLRFAVQPVRPISLVLADLGFRGEDFDSVILTHAHYDHLGGASAFPRARFYLQKRELQGWLDVLARPQTYSFLTAAIDPADIRGLSELMAEHRLTLVEGQVDDLFPGISLVPVWESHTYGSQVVTVEQASPANGKWVFTGDACYTLANFGDNPPDGPFLPVGFGVGSLTEMVSALVKIYQLAGGELGRLIIPHDPTMWETYPSRLTSGGMHIAEIQLAAGEETRLA